MAKKGTALGVARDRFVDGLPRKAGELRGAIALLAGAPDEDRPREELRRRLHALFASSQVFRLESLASALKEAVERLDGAREANRAVSSEDLDALANLAATLPGLAAGIDADTPSVASGPRAAAPRQSRPSLARIELARVARPRQITNPGFPSVVPEAEAEVILPEIPLAPRIPRSSAPPRPSGSFTAGRSGSSRPSNPPGDIFDTVVSVLVVDRAASQARVREALPVERFEVLGAADPEEALRIARSSAPDVVLLDGHVGTAEIVARLRADPLTDRVPIARIHDGDPMDAEALLEAGFDVQIDRGVGERELAERIAALAGSGHVFPGTEELGDATMGEIAERLAKEIYRGLVDAAGSGRDVRVPFGDGSELLAAAWATIARVRASVAERSEGKVRFDDAGRGGPALISLVDEPLERPSSESDVDLAGRRIIVADDDPAVVWFFAGLLREAGADVLEVEDGAQALDAARRRRPDVILSDILMPNLDGLALCRELQRDPALSEVPVILLSWKEDFLQRMRELQSGASGYLRKEAQSAQILARVKEVLRPRARLDASLRAGGEVRGRVEGLGVVPLLRAAASERPDARITVRDAWNLFELDLRGGDAVDITRTATDGSFARGPRAFTQLLGVSAGRFAIATADGAVRPSLKGSLDERVDEAAAELGALVDAVSGPRLTQVESLTFDEDIMRAFVRTSPSRVRRVVERLHAGQRPRDLMVSGEVDPQLLGSTLVDLARRGAVTAVRGPGGTDLVAEALGARGRPATDLDWLPAEEQTGDIVSAAHTALQTAGDATPEVEAAEREADADGDADESESEDGVAGADGAAGEDESDAAGEDESGVAGENEDGVADGVADEVENAADEMLFELEVGEPIGEPSVVIADPAQTSDSLLDAPTNPPPLAPISELTSAPAPAPRAASASPPPNASAPKDEGMGLMGSLFVLTLCGVVGFFVYDAVHDSREVRETDAPITSPERAEPSEPSPEVVPEPASEPDPPVAPNDLAFGTTVDHLLDVDVEVAEGEGLLVVRAPTDGSEVRVIIGGEPPRDLGPAPVSIGLPEGDHEVVFRIGDDERYRYIYLRAGQTRVVRPD